MKTSFLSIITVAMTLICLDASPPELQPTTIHQLPDRRIIIERVPGIIVPDPPVPIMRPAPTPETAERFVEMATRWRAHRIQNPTIHAGVTVYRLPDGKIVTHVRNWNINNGPAVSFWSSADFTLLAQAGGFTASSLDGKVKYTMLLFCSLHDIAQRQNFMKRRGHTYQLPGLPEFPDGPATWMLAESAVTQKPDDPTLLAITRIHEHYNKHLALLKQTFAEVEAIRESRRAE